MLSAASILAPAKRDVLVDDDCDALALGVTPVSSFPMPAVADVSPHGPAPTPWL